MVLLRSESRAACVQSFTLRQNKRTAWGCKGCGRIRNAGKLAIIWAKIFKIWAKYTATFTCNEVVSIFQTEAK